MLCPITFSIPSSKIVDRLPEKTKLLSSLIPGNLSTYVYATEEEYYAEYRTSCFAMTTKKAGWDCLRHYEILANGCVPYFPDLQNCPPNTLSRLPKDLLLEGNALYERFLQVSTPEASLFPEAKPPLPASLVDEYISLANRLLDYTRTHLSTTASAKYIVDRIGKPVNRVLYLSGDTSPDYLRCLTLHGFKTLLECDDFPQITHIYKNADVSNLYGKGMSYTQLLDPEPPIHEDEVVQRIKDRYYDVVIYGSYHRGMPMYDFVLQNYSPRDVILLCGEDEHRCNGWAHVNNGHIVFVREL
jgi:hypothetical protein